MKRILSAAVFTVAFASAAFTADLYVEARFDVTAKDLSKSYLTVKGAAASVNKDTVDAATGASKAKGTEILNTYRNGADKKSMMPGGLQSLLKYGVSPAHYFSGDKLTVEQAKDGTITVQYVHRGTAYKMVSDKKGNFVLPGADCKLRKIANLEKDGSQTVSTDFSPTGKVEDINWASVWDASIAEGSVITSVTGADGKVTEVKTGKIIVDAGASEKPYAGTFTMTFKNNILFMKASLDIKK
ncbi:MAG TPA: hypothetical protein PK408_03725 [Treponemataceae bacterium]|jgi:hypothetical protein|nr:hypothetical protein [Treponemataceae bacterium]